MRKNRSWSIALITWALGGAAALIKPRLNVAVELVDNLVLEGLLEIAKQR